MTIHSSTNKKKEHAANCHYCKHRTSEFQNFLCSCQFVSYKKHGASRKCEDFSYDDKRYNEYITQQNKTNETKTSTH